MQILELLRKNGARMNSNQSNVSQIQTPPFPAQFPHGPDPSQFNNGLGFGNLNWYQPPRFVARQSPQSATTSPVYTAQQTHINSSIPHIPVNNPSQQPHTDPSQPDIDQQMNDTSNHPSREMMQMLYLGQHPYDLILLDYELVVEDNDSINTEMTL